MAIVQSRRQANHLPHGQEAISFSWRRDANDTSKTEGVLLKG
ncbi:hypothetical protein [Allocoleopsis franciscana]|nr:hypothetical protein [Allocoleopsis franciscana]